MNPLSASANTSALLHPGLLHLESDVFLFFYLSLLFSVFALLWPACLRHPLLFLVLPTFKYPSLSCPLARPLMLTEGHIAFSTENNPPHPHPHPPTLESWPEDSHLWSPARHHGTCSLALLSFAFLCAIINGDSSVWFTFSFSFLCQFSVSGATVFQVKSENEVKYHGW